MQASEKAKFFKQGKSFVGLLPYAKYDRENDIFELEDGSIGCALVVRLPGTDFMSEEQMEGLSNNLNSFYKRLHPKTTVQCILTCDDGIDYEVDQFVQATTDTSNPIINAAMKMKELCYRNGAKNYFFKTKLDSFCAKRIRLIVTIRYFPPELKPNGFLGMFSGKKPTVSEIFEKKEEEFKDILMGMRASAEITFQRMGTLSRHLDVYELMDYVYRKINPGRAEAIRIRDHEEHKDIREQVLFNSPAAASEYWVFEPVLNEDGKLNTEEGYFSSVVTMKDLPGQTWAGMLTKANGGSSMMDQAKTFTLVMNVYINSPHIEKKELKGKQKEAETSIDGASRDNRKAPREAMRKQEEADYLLGMMDIEGQRMINVRCHLLVQGHGLKEYKDNREKMALALDDVGVESIFENEIGAGLFMTCLPLNFEPSQEKKIKRLKKALTKNVADLSPCYGSPIGTTTPDMLLPNLRGELSNICVWDTDGSANATVIGGSGSGKSFFVGGWVSCLLRLDTKVIMIDRGNSYKPLCRITGGQTMTLNKDNPTCVNPFHGSLRGKKEQFLAVYLKLIASGGNEREELTEEESSTLMGAVRMAYEMKQIKFDFKNDYEIHEKCREQVDETFIAWKRNRVSIRYENDDDLVELIDEKDDADKGYEMNLYRLIELDLDVYEAHREKLDSYAVQKNLRIVQDVKVATFRHSGSDLDQLKTMVDDTIRTRGRVFVSLGDIGVKKEAFLAYLTEHKVSHEKVKNGYHVRYLSNEVLLAIQDMLGKDLDATLDCDLSEVRDGVVSVGHKTWMMYEHEFRDLDGVQISCDVEKVLVEFEVTQQRQQIEDMIGAESGLKVRKGHVHVYIFGPRERKAINAISGLHQEYELVSGSSILQRELYFSDVGRILMMLSQGEDIVIGGEHLDMRAHRTERMKEFYASLYRKLAEYFNGSYRKMFDGPMEFDIESKFTVFETEQLDPKNIAELAYLLSLFNSVYEYYQSPDIIGISKYLFLEEGWVFLGNKKVADYLSDIFRTARKWGFSCVVITQQPEDFLSTEAGRGVFNNAPNRFFLQQPQDAMKLISTQLDLNDVQRDALMGVHTRMGYYSEIYIKTQRVQGIFRNMPDPVFYWLVTTDKRDRALRDGYTKEYADQNIRGRLALAKSVLRCAGEYPYGVTREKASPDDPLVLALSDIDLSI